MDSGADSGLNPGSYLTKLCVKLLEYLAQRRCYIDDSQYYYLIALILKHVGNNLP